MLLRALRDVGHGFYVDVGAQDPVVDSVTRLFYERGWRGINIDPVEHWYRRLCEDRPEDINLDVAVGSGLGPVKFYEVIDSGLSTADESFARRHELAGYALKERLVPCRRLDSILDEYRPGTIHFLKVDCEGAERSVLESIDLRRWRPWIILLEATEPNSQMPTHGEWEELLVAGGYQFAYADGLNRFYVASEQHALLAAFLVPPNVFDRFVTRRESDAIMRVQQLSSELARATERKSHLDVELAMAMQHEHDLQASISALHEQASRDSAAIRRLEDLDRRRVLAEAELEMVKHSLSWKMTAPLRWIRPALARLRASTRPGLQKLARWAARVRPIRVLVARTIGRFPQAKRRAVALIYGSSGALHRAAAGAADAIVADASGVDVLSRPAADALANLKRNCR